MLVVDAKKIHEAARARAETKITSNPVKQDQKKIKTSIHMDLKSLGVEWSISPLGLNYLKECMYCINPLLTLRVDWMNGVSI